MKHHPQSLSQHIILKLSSHFIINFAIINTKAIFLLSEVFKDG